MLHLVQVPAQRPGFRFPWSWRIVPFGYSFSCNDLLRMVVIELIILLSGFLPNPKLETAVLSICIQVTTTIYTIPEALGSSASTRVSNALGAGRSHAARVSVFAAMTLADSVAIVVSSAIFACRHILGYVFSNEKDVVDYVTAMVPLGSLSVLLDSLHSCLSGIARGCGWQDLGVYVNLGTYYIFGILLLLCWVSGQLRQGRGYFSEDIQRKMDKVELVKSRFESISWLKKKKKTRERMAASFAYPASTFLVKCSSTRESQDKNSQQPKSSIKVNGSFRTPVKIDSLSQTAEANSTLNYQVASVAENGQRQNIPTKKQLVDPYRHGEIVEGGVGYRQTVVIRSYEVGADKTATLESILNLLQETALNHVWMSGLLGDGFGATHGMMKNNLIWVVSRMQVQVDYYPIWGEVTEIDTWVGASGKNGMRRDWLIRSKATGLVFARATSTWVMMNRATRRLSKIPVEVKDEIFPWFIEKQAINEDAHEKIVKLDKEVKYMNSDLKPKRSDLDMNQHVNNVKYVKWMLQTIPDQVLESHQLSEITLEFRRECGKSDIVQSLCQPEEDEVLHDIMKQDYNTSLLNGFASEIIKGNGVLACLEERPMKYTHLLQVKGEEKSEEIVRGRTAWKRKPPKMPFPSY
ncbi:hypothetical protein L6164_001652 [Bauhinia variegata]|uniref:Uncharacterized protein n=1 Tax=Bauhinia variegata TaxID=167791 RepID=A0ACB9QAS0_BAUVA|nr:hypothetical protein L6164_001652 [Bauhinia variegata]